jgi:translation elongation factor EF-Ts
MTSQVHARLIQSYVHTGRIGVLIELGTETRLQHGNEDFLAFAKDLAMHVAAMNPADVSSLLRQGYFKEPHRSVLSVLEAAAEQFQESIVVTRMVRWDAEDGPPVPVLAPEPPRNPAMLLRLNKRG